MPPDLYPPLIIVFLVALALSAIELRAALEPPVCPQCVHCRHRLLERRQEEARIRDVQARRIWGEHDDDERPR